MRKRKGSQTNWFFELEFQLGANDKYVADVNIGSRISGDIWITAPLGEYETIEAMKEDFKKFQRDFITVYTIAGHEVLKRKGVII